MPGYSAIVIVDAVFKIENIDKIRVYDAVKESATGHHEQV